MPLSFLVCCGFWFFVASKEKMTAITNLIIVLMPVIIMGLAIIVKDGF
jgi:hypothetical protein